jgi:hypothetical protein
LNRPPRGNFRYLYAFSAAIRSAVPGVDQAVETDLSLRVAGELWRYCLKMKISIELQPAPDGVLAHVIDGKPMNTGISRGLGS